MICVSYIKRQRFFNIIFNVNQFLTFNKFYFFRKSSSRRGGGGGYDRNNNCDPTKTSCDFQRKWSHVRKKVAIFVMPEHRKIFNNFTSFFFLNKIFPSASMHRLEQNLGVRATIRIVETSNSRTLGIKTFGRSANSWKVGFFCTCCIYLSPLTSQKSVPKSVPRKERLTERASVDRPTQKVHK